MAIGFSNIPADIRVPLFYAEMDNSAANSASSAMRRLIVAQVNDNIAPADVGKLVLVSSVALAKSIGGQGSMLASMYETWRKTDPIGTRLPDLCGRDNVDVTERADQETLGHGEYWGEKRLRADITRYFETIPVRERKESTLANS